MVSTFPFLAVIIFILLGIGISTGIFDCMDNKCKCSECKEDNNTLIFFKFFVCLISCLFCFGGLWIKREDFREYELDFCSLDE